MHDPATLTGVSPLGPRAIASPHLIAATRSAWDLGDVAATEDLGGTYNLNLRLRTERGVMVLRVYRPWVTPERLAMTQRVRTALHRHGLPVLLPIPTRSGTMAISVGDRLLEMEPWQPDDGGTTDRDRLFAAATILGRLHDGLRGITLDVPFVSAPVSNDLSPAVFDDWLGRTVRAIASATRTEQTSLATRACREAERIAMTARAIPRETGPHQLVHGDYGHENVRFSGSIVTAVVDFDFLHQGARIVDLADLAFCPHWMAEFGQSSRSPAERDWGIVAGIIRRYDAASRVPLSPAEIAALPLAMAAVPLNWIAASWLLDDPIAAVALIAPELPTAAWLIDHHRELAAQWASRRPSNGSC